MAARPIDFQTSLPKLPELSRMQKERESHWQVKNEQFSAELQQQALTRQNKVVTPSQAEKTELGKETEKRQKQREQESDTRKKKKAAADTTGPEADLGHHIDIRA